MNATRTTLAGQVILVAGGASEIGRVCCAEITACGGMAVVADMDAAAARATAESLGPQTLFRELDVRSERARADCCAWIIAQTGRLDGLANCAGVTCANDTVEELDETGWRSLMEINLDGAFLGCQTMIRSLRGQGRGGAIVNITSVLGIAAGGGSFASSTTLGAVRHLTKNAARYAAAERLDRA